MKKMPTGIPGFDEILEGGLVPNRSYLLVGPAGAGKTVLSLQWLLDGARRGERCMCATLSEPPQMMENNIRSFGWSLADVEMLNLTDTNVEQVEDYRVFAPSEVERAPLYRELYDAIEEFRPDRLVIDSLTQLRYVSADEYQFRKQMLALVAFLSRQGCTSILTHEPYELSLDVSAALAVDGIIRLWRDPSEHRATEIRSLQVEKFRGSDYRAGKHHFRFTSDGICIYPHRPFARAGDGQSRQQFRSGVEALDKLLGGGLELGTSTLISGPTGVGKSTIAALLMSQAVENSKGVYVSFEEAPGSILYRNEGIGLPLRRRIEEGQLILEYVYPRQYFPDEFCHRFERFVEDGVRFVAIDGLRGYNFAMEAYGQPVNDLQNLCSFLASSGVSVILTNEVEVITGDLKATEIGASHLADNLLLLRYAEYSGEVIKVIGCLKKRLGVFEPELRELRISAAPHGISVGPRLQHLRGILTGVPTFEPERHSSVAPEKPEVKEV